ncbi:MAG TPA: glycosyl hydrolase family 28 protein [Prolixibacteraceae bacterium]|nr:glycosyl hydrolase family 28 protein [Prolixibacteraceae bacterium]
MKTYNITNFGAIGDGKTDNAKAIQQAIDTCTENGGGQVLIPAGTFMTGPFDLKSNVEFHVSAGATVLANPDEMVYTQSAFKENKGEGSIWMGGKDAVNVTISGQGTIDGNGPAFMGPEEKAAYILKEFDTFDRRPHLFTPINFRNLIIRDVTFNDSAYWNLHLVGCNDVTIHGVKILNNLKIRNSDGIDPDHCKNVRISDCYIESGDDCICPKTRREYEEYGPTENITVTNCILKSTSCSIKLGSENMDAIRNVVISNCIIRSSNRAIGIQNRDEGVVENIIFENIIIEGRLFDNVWWGKAEPIYVTAYKRQPGNARDANWRFAKGQTSGQVGEVKNILFSNILAQSENGVYVGGEPGKISNIRFRNVDIKIDKTTSYQGGLYDLRPSDTVGILQAETTGFYFDEAKAISLNDCKVRWGKNLQPYFGPALFASRINGLEISGFNGESAFPEQKKSFTITDCENIYTDHSIKKGE